MIYITFEDEARLAADLPLRKEDIHCLVEKAKAKIPVVEVRANSLALTEIRRQFPNVLHAKKATEVTWFGDDARFIAANL